jgi:hypothetical protein
MRLTATPILLSLALLVGCGEGYRPYYHRDHPVVIVEREHHEHHEGGHREGHEHHGGEHHGHSEGHR